MRFWDSSALVPLLVSETTTEAVGAELERDPEVVVWWGSEVECVSALSRLEREGRLSSGGMVVALQRMASLAESWREIQPVGRVRQDARRLLRVHDLRAGDAFQLAAALVGSEGEPATLGVVTLDDRLARAAEREGFPVVEPRA